MEKPLFVKAIHAYTPAHNDELKLIKDDVITVTQKEDGWWEGTLNGVTGWFPFNYVTPVQDDQPTKTFSSSSSDTDSYSGHKFSPKKKSNGGSGPTLVPAMTPSSATTSSSSTDEQLRYRQTVLIDLIDSERGFVNELQDLWNRYLQHLHLVQGFSHPTVVQFQLLGTNVSDMIQAHMGLLRQLELEQNKPFKDQRIGKVFLDHASKLEQVQKSYSEHHPRSVKLLNENSKGVEKGLETKPTSTGILPLIIGLTVPFRRFEKYPTMLQQIERRVEESHKDRGDLQRSIEYFKETDKYCGALRKQKEMELEVLHGTIAGWEGTDVAQLGDIVHMNLVHIGQDLQPRYFVLFTNTLLILSYNSEQNTLSYEGKIPVSGVTLPPISDKNKHLSTAFEIAGPMIEPILVNCISRAVKDTWLSQFSKVLKASRYPSHVSSTSSSQHQSYGQLSPPVQAWSISRLRPNPPTNPVLYDPSVIHQAINGAKGTPTKVGQGQGYDRPTVGPQLTVTLTHEEDLTILSIVDAFCSGNRQTSGGAGSEVKSSPGGTTPQRSTITLSQLVFGLRDDLGVLKGTVDKLWDQLESERRARLELQYWVKGQLKVVCVDNP